MNGMIFDEKTLFDENIFKYESRLKSQLNRYTENGMLLTTYFSQREDATTVDRGTRDIEELFGNRSPLRFNKINNVPINGFGQAAPNNNEESEIEDFSVEGEAIIIPGTIIPKQFDFFIIEHLKMNAIFEVKSVTYDNMKIDGNFKIEYRLHSTSQETINNLMKLVVDEYVMNLNSIGSDLNPVIKKDDYIYKEKVEQMVALMIRSYKSLFYNERHNCFLYHDPKTNEDYFDICANEFMAKFSIINIPNSFENIILSSKVRDPQLPYYYNNSIFNWIEMDAPKRLLQRFYYSEVSSDSYPDSSFYLWDDLVNFMIPLPTNKKNQTFDDRCYLDNERFQSYLREDKMPECEYDKLIWKYIHQHTSIRIQDISLYIGDMLISSMNNKEIYLFTPIIIYIIRKILKMK